MDLLVSYYKDILSKKKFYLPLLFFAIVAYSFSIYNRTLSWDDLMRDHYIGSGNIMLSGRWGMVLWAKLLGLVDFMPFIDRFTALCFYVVASILLSFLFYQIDRFDIDVLSHMVLCSIFITYPLVNEIWEYGVANFVMAGGLCLVTIAVVIIRTTLSYKRKIFISSLLLILPVSSYESVAFYYVALYTLLIFYDNKRNVKPISFNYWVKINLNYIVPLAIAVLFRFVVSFIINLIFKLDYSAGGATSIEWLNSDLFSVIYTVISQNFVLYCIYALVYFPISIFFFFLILFFIYIAVSKNNRRTSILLGVLLIMTLFLQSIIQGMPLPYRTAQTITLFVAFVTYIVCRMRNEWHGKKKYVLLLPFCLLCWYQAVYLNKLLCLNNLRSNNEEFVVRQVGNMLVSSHNSKRVVFVSPFQSSEWIDDFVTVNEKSWNGSLFYKIEKNIPLDLKPFKFVKTNVNAATEEYPQIKDIFNYYGYDIDVISPKSKPHTTNFSRKDSVILNEAIRIAKEKQMKPYQIIDNNNYIIVKLGDRYFESDGGFRR